MFKTKKSEFFVENIMHSYYLSLAQEFSSKCYSFDSNLSFFVTNMKKHNTQKYFKKDSSPAQSEMF